MNYNYVLSILTMLLKERVKFSSFPLKRLLKEWNDDDV